MEKERYILTKEDIDKVVHLVMEEGYSMEYAAKMATGCTPNTFRKKFLVGYPGTKRTTPTSGRLTNGSAED